MDAQRRVTGGDGALALDELLALEHQGWQALCEGRGAEFYGQLMTEDGLMVLAGGQVMDRPAVVASLGEAPRWAHYEISGVRSVPLADGAATLVYLGRASRSDEEPFVAAMSSTYRVVDGRPRLAVYQQTQVA